MLLLSCVWLHVKRSYPGLTLVFFPHPKALGSRQGKKPLKRPSQIQFSSLDYKLFKPIYFLHVHGNCRECARLEKKGSIYKVQLCLALVLLLLPAAKLENFNFYRLEQEKSCNFCVATFSYLGETFFCQIFPKLIGFS